MVRVYLLLFLINLVLSVIALINCLSAEEGEIRALPRIAWVFIILLFSPVGPIAWFLAGRPLPAGADRRTWRPGAVPPARERTRPLAPDDDPDFLRSLGERRLPNPDRVERPDDAAGPDQDPLRQRKPEDDGTPEDRPA